MRNELTEAKNCLERACPLMELLPASLLENMAMGGTGPGTPDFSHDSWFGPEINVRKREKSSSANSNFKKGSPGESGSNYAADCFAMLRSVYIKLYRTAKLDENVVEKLRLKSTPDLSTLAASNSQETIDLTKAENDFVSQNGEESLADVEFDEDERIEHLRMPFQHLRSELLLVHQARDNPFKTTGSLENPRSRLDKGHSFRTSFSDERIKRGASSKSETRRSSTWNTPAHENAKLQSLPFRNVFLGGVTSIYSKGPADDGSQFTTKSPSWVEDDELRSLEGDEYHDNYLMGLSSSATSIIAADMEIMLRKFVKEDDVGRRELLEVAEKYYDELDLNFPDVRPCVLVGLCLRAIFT